MFSVVLVEVKGIEPSDSDLARITRNPITTPVNFTGSHVLNRMLSSISTNHAMLLW